MSDQGPSNPRGDLLAVDDNPHNLRLLLGILSQQGYHVRPAASGRMALTAAYASPPDLVLLDIRMAHMDGYEVCQHLKADNRTRDIPIIFLSALSDVSKKVKAFEVGGVDYITKPFQSEEVLMRVATHLKIQALQKSLREKVGQLEDALTKIDTLHGLLPICSYCKNIRDDAGYWQQVEVYIAQHSSAEFSHSICPNCLKRHYPNIHKKMGL